MPGITTVHHGDFSKKSTSPAFCNRSTGELYINTPYFERLNRNQQFYVLLHELGHIVLQTEDENKADAYASKIYLKKGYPLSESVKALSRVLKFNKSGDYQRLENQFLRAANYDLQVNNNQKIKEMKIPQNISAFSWDSIGGLLNNVNDKVNDVGNLYNSIGNIAGKFGNNGGSGGVKPIYVPTIPMPQKPVEEKKEEKKKNNTMLYVGLGIGLIVVVTIIIMVLRKK